MGFLSRTISSSEVRCRQRLSDDDTVRYIIYHIFYNYKCYKANIYYDPSSRIISSELPRCQNAKFYLYISWYIICNILYCSISPIVALSNVSFGTTEIRVVNYSNDSAESHVKKTTVIFLIQLGYRQTSERDFTRNIWIILSHRHALKSSDP